jgi:hypothetical protein
MKTVTNIVHLTFALIAFASLALTPATRAVNPPPDGGYAGGNTAEGQDALLGLTTGGFNTAVGFLSLTADSTNSFNTGIGAGALLANTADENTATGAGALLNNATGIQNVANGVFALFNNTTGSHNTAVGSNALFHNTGSSNTGIGDDTLLGNTAGQFNIAIGDSAGANSIGDSNVIIGTGAGNNITTASNVICINTSGENVSNTCYIANIFSAANAGGTAVFVNGDGQLHTMTSSKRFKEDIKPINDASKALYALRPVSFRYKKEIDATAKSQFGLVAEDVEKVNPDLIVRDKDGRPYTVRYDAVNAMLLNEFLKEHRTVQEQNATIAELRQNFAQQQKQIEALTAGLQKVSVQLEARKPESQMVKPNQ